MTTAAITNNTGHLIYLPPVDRWQEGFRLIPGLNRIPKAYLEAAYARSQPACDEYGKPIVRTESRSRQVVTKDAKGREVVVSHVEEATVPVLRYPIKAALERLFGEKVLIVRSTGKHIGPRLTEHAEGDIDESAPLGVPAPLDLPGTDAAALHMVNNCDDRAALVRWAAEDMRDSVRRACAAKLGEQA